MDPRREVIVPNIDRAGGILNGRIQTRNAVEAGILTLLSIALTEAISPFIPSIVRIVLTTVLVLSSLFFGILGIRGHTLSEWLVDKINYETTKCYVTFKLPLPKERRDLIDEEDD